MEEWQYFYLLHTINTTWAAMQMWEFMELMIVRMIAWSHVSQSWWAAIYREVLREWNTEPVIMS